MLTAFYQAFRTPDLRKKLLFTLFIIVDLPARRLAADAGRFRDRGARVRVRRDARPASSAW